MKNTPKINIYKLTIELTQEGNTLGTTEEIETLEIRFEYQLPGGEPFLVVKTAGWSADDPEEFKNILKKASKAESLLRKAIE